MKLADPEFNISKEIGILLSSDIVFNVFCSAKIPPRHRKLPFIFNSKLRWLFAGACKSMSQPNYANSFFTVHVANQLDELEQLNNSWYYLEVPDAVQSVNEVCETSGSETIITNDEDWYVEGLPYKISREKLEPEPGFEPRISGFLGLPMKVGTTKFCDSIPHEVKDLHFIEKRFESVPELKEIHCEGKDVSHMYQVDSLHNDEVLHNTESKFIGTSTDVEIVSDVPTKTPIVIPSNTITVDFGIQCDLDNDVSKDLNTCANNMHLLSDSKVVMSGLKSESCKEKSSMTNGVIDIQQPVVGATRQNVSSKNRSANKTHRDMSSIDIMCFILRLFFVLFTSCNMEFYPDSDYNVQGSQKDVYNLSSSDFIPIRIIDWKFIPPHSLHIGNLWDVEIKNLNHRLRKRQICLH